ncbi:MAG: hypothetical protein Q8914_00410 [Bacteroidota bacterium]|nr:hypothetical protein [Bacteroidota bacterium]
MKRVLFLLLLLAGWSYVATAATWDTYSDTWVAVDDLGRKVPSSDDGLSAPRTDKTLGMFYFICFGPHGINGHPVYDMTNMLTNNPDSITWGEEGEAIWWSKPVMNYYVNGDPYLYDKHLQMLSDAGIDFLFLDITNAFTYDDAVQALLSAIDRRTANGEKSPKLCYMIHSAAQSTLYHIYDQFYKYPANNKYWYYYEGKPLVLFNADEKNNISSWNQTITGHFTFRYSWAWMSSQPNYWQWLDYYPQDFGYDSNGKIEQITVGVSQHATSKIGRSYHNRKEPSINRYALCDSTSYGLYVEEQWKRAHEVDPPLIMVTQFNEWTAGRFVIKSTSEFGNCRPGATPKIGESYFVDEYNGEFSRDLEPSWHPLIRDNYWMQFVSHARRYKGVRPIPVPSAAKTIDINGDTSQWTSVYPEFRDDIGDITHRDTKGYQNTAPVVNTTGRNDIVCAKVTKDADNLYFYVRTNSRMTNFLLSKNWMILYLNTDADYSTGWKGYDFIVQRDTLTGKYSLMRNTGNTYHWETVSLVTYRQPVGNVLQLAIPKNLIGMTDAKDLDFKWADNVPSNPDILDFITDGDVAPNGRFNYRYKGSDVSTYLTPVNSHSLSFSAIVSRDNELSLTYTLTYPATISFYLYNLRGQLMKSFPAFHSEAGVYELSGGTLSGYGSDGVYFVKAVLGEKVIVQKIMASKTR